jgi:hypothetical protein
MIVKDFILNISHGLNGNKFTWSQIYLWHTTNVYSSQHKDFVNLDFVISNLKGYYMKQVTYPNLWPIDLNNTHLRKNLQTITRI